MSIEKKFIFIPTLAFASLSAADASVLIDNDFGAGLDTGPSFQQVANGVGSGGSSNTTTGVVTSGASVNSAYGLNSSSTVDASTASGFTIVWDVASASIGTVDGPASNGWFFGVTTSTSTGGSGLYNNSNQALGIRLLGSGGSGTDMVFVQDSDGAGGPQLTSSLGVAVSTAASYEDGFSISLTVNNDDSWSAFSTGLSADFSTSGTLDTTASGFSYADVADSLVAYSSIQGLSLSYTVDNVTLSAIPEPSSFALLAGLIGLTSVLIRRRNVR